MAFAFAGVHLHSRETEEQKKVDALLKRFEKNEVTFEIKDYINVRLRMMNMYLSRCHACDAFAVWIKDRLAWPAHSLKIDAISALMSFQFYPVSIISF